MDADHVTFAGLVIPDMSNNEVETMRLGFMWHAVIEFVEQPQYDHVVICLHERFGSVAMQMGDRLKLQFRAFDGCRVDSIHVMYMRHGHTCG